MSARSRGAFAVAAALLLPACMLPTPLSAVCQQQVSDCLRLCQPSSGVDTQAPDRLSQDGRTACEKSCHDQGASCRPGN